MFNRFAIALVIFVSRFFRVLSPRTCRFHPSCSEYSTQAFSEMDFWRALRLTGRRILKCHPFHPGGHDPLWKKEL